MEIPIEKFDHILAYHKLDQTILKGEAAPDQQPAHGRNEATERNEVFIVDCDCHNYWSSATVLTPYLSGLWKDMFTEGEKTGPVGAFPHGHRPWFHPQDFSRKDVRPKTEADNYLFMKEK